MAVMKAMLHVSSNKQLRACLKFWLKGGAFSEWRALNWGEGEYLLLSITDSSLIEAAKVINKVEVEPGFPCIPIQLRKWGRRRGAYLRGVLVWHYGRRVGTDWGKYFILVLCDWQQSWAHHFLVDTITLPFLFWHTCFTTVINCFHLLNRGIWSTITWHYKSYQRRPDWEERS